MILSRFDSLVADAPDAVALIERGAVISRASLRRRAAEIATQIREVCAPNEVIGVRLRNSTDFVAVLLATCEVGRVLALFDRDAAPAEVERVTRHLGVAVMAVEGDEGVAFERRDSPPPRLPPAARILKLTSGSSGMPKAIVCSEENLVADATNICSTMNIRDDDRNIGAIPFSHSYGFSNLVMPLLIQGTAVVITNDYVPASLLSLCNDNACTVAPLIPMVFEHLASLPAHDGGFETVRTFISAGAPLGRGTSSRFLSRYGKPIHSFYGCSETGGISYDVAGGSVERGTVGRALDGVSISVERDSQRLVIRGKSVALGELHDAVTFAPFDGTFTADDLVELDQRGEIHLAGRASELINAAGRKVNPREVEHVLRQLDGVRDVKVYGEAAGARGEVVVAVIAGDASITRDTVRAFCASRLAAHKVPRIVKVVEEIPVDDRGKIRRAALAAL